MVMVVWIFNNLPRRKNNKIGHSSQEIMEGLTIRIERVKNGEWMKLCKRNTWIKVPALVSESHPNSVVDKRIERILRR
ncbi:hypothetical protein HZH68_017151 [Vespula germanica]|uniref:Uncharacterized protein n=1 Tax=Vespula germanica TaxID=30212 RepID=A0A834J5C0_VESGE|nr:hypothetical protein HZH68_017151 [Vespula germanica]